MRPSSDGPRLALAPSTDRDGGAPGTALQHHLVAEARELESRLSAFARRVQAANVRRPAGVIECRSTRGLSDCT